MIAAGLLPLTSDQDALEKAAKYEHDSKATLQARDEQLRLREKVPMITQTLLDSQRACMTADAMQSHRSCPGRLGAAVQPGMVLPTEGRTQEENTAPVASWRRFEQPSDAMAKKVTEFEKSIGGFKLAQEQFLRNKHLALKTKEEEMKRRWQPKILVIQDEISLAPAAVENMMLYRTMRARQDEGLDPPSYAQPGELMGHIPILLIAGDFLQINPANEISLADDLEELVRKAPHRVQSEHYAAQAAVMSIETAADQRHARRKKTADAQLTHQLLTIPNPHRTGKLQGMLLLHENMVVRLADVLAPHLGLVKDKLAVVVKVDLHHADQQRLANLEPGFRQFFPEFMAKGIWVKLLKGQNLPMEETLLQKWDEECADVTEHAADAKSLLFLLRSGPPPYLRQLTDKLEAKAALTFERLRSWPAYDASSDR
ncbi:unnamed protein product [Durusdinium trenchii]|uniref:DNA helicase n=1 Tax=Durusdinium trenchii TaxID=1381693 RepID=A0ABP0RTX3_9DINO